MKAVSSAFILLMVMACVYPRQQEGHFKQKTNDTYVVSASKIGQDGEAIAQRGAFEICLREQDSGFTILVQNSSSQSFEMKIKCEGAVNEALRSKYSAKSGAFSSEGNAWEGGPFFISPNSE